MPTFIEDRSNRNKETFLGHEDLHLGHKVPLVERDDIMRRAIHSEHIAPGAVTNDKIAPGSVGMEQLAPEAVEDLSRLKEELRGLIEDARGTIGIGDVQVMTKEDVPEMMARVLGE